MASITFVDIDETLFFTDVRVGVVSHDGTKRMIKNKDFNTYQLKSGEKFDFSEFRSASVFRQTSTPNEIMIKKVNALFRRIQKTDPKSRIVLLTARAPFTDSHVPFRAALIDSGLNVNAISEVVFCGDDTIDKNAPTAMRKAIKAAVFLATGVYSQTALYDDNKENLDGFLELRKRFPDITVKAFLVDSHGIPKPYGATK